MVFVVRAYLALAGVVLAAGLVGLILPANVRIERSVFIARPAATVYTLAARPATFPEWAPMGAARASYAFEGPDMGVGARAAWTTDDARAGRLVVVAAEPYALVESDVDFGARGRARMSVAITPEDGGVRTTWTVTTGFGLNLVKRYVALGLDQRLGRDLERGLERLKGLAETTPSADFADADVEVIALTSRAIAYAERTVRGDSADHQAAFEAALADVRQFLARRRVAVAGPIYTVTLDWRPPVWRFQVAAPYDGDVSGGEGPVALGRSPAGAAVRAVHEGDTRGAAALYDKLEAYVAARRMQPAGPIWEAMITDRETVAPQDQLTEIFIPVAGDAAD